MFVLSEKQELYCQDNLSFRSNLTAALKVSCPIFFVPILGGVEWQALVIKTSDYN
jgi:hypothetical protein